MKRKLWFSYSIPNADLDVPEPRNSPYTIAWNLGHYLRYQARERGWDFEYRNLDDRRSADIKADDIVIGHFWFDGGFMDIALDSPARAKFIIQPYSKDGVNERDAPRLNSVFDKADHLFLVTGPYWWATMKETVYAKQQAKATCLDMAVNGKLHPYSKTEWNPPGKRRFLAIGADIPYKGLDMIADLAQTSGFHLGYYGNAPMSRFQHVPRFSHYGGADFTPELIEFICREYDGFISLARGDANPTTLLETACWGLVGLCNQESGYYPYQPFIPLRLNDMHYNLTQIERIQKASERELRTWSVKMQRHVATTYTWRRFCETVWNKMQEYL